jgi:hypothetical protein
MFATETVRGGTRDQRALIAASRGSVISSSMYSQVQPNSAIRAA